MEDTNAKKKTVPYKLFFISLVRRQVKRWQGNCENKLKPADNGDYLLIKSHGASSYSFKGESKIKGGSLKMIASKNTHI